MVRSVRDLREGLVFSEADLSKATTARSYHLETKMSPISSGDFQSQRDKVIKSARNSSPKTSTRIYPSTSQQKREHRLATDVLSPAISGKSNSPPQSPEVNVSGQQHASAVQKGDTMTRTDRPPSPAPDERNGAEVRQLDSTGTSP